MAQPVLFVLDDDAGVAGALRDDLSRRFREDFRVIGETSAASGLATLRELADAGLPVALLIVDHNMSEMPGVDFLARAHEMHPKAKRVLLVERDYSVRSPAVRAMTLGQADYHLSKPWMLETSVPGVFAAGDARCRSIKRVASAVGDGATVVRIAQEYIAGDHADEPTRAVLA